MRVNPAAARAWTKGLLAQPLRRHVDQAVVARRQQGHGAAQFVAVHAAVDRHGLLAQRRRQAVELVFHQRDQRGDHERQPRAGEGGQLVAERLARAGGQDRQHMLAARHGGHHFGLAGQQVRVAEEPLRILGQLSPLRRRHRGILDRRHRRQGGDELAARQVARWDAACTVRSEQVVLARALAVAVEAGDQLLVELLHAQRVGAALEEVAQRNQFGHAQLDAARGAVDGFVGKRGRVDQVAAAFINLHEAEVGLAILAVGVGQLLEDLFRGIQLTLGEKQIALHLRAERCGGAVVLQRGDHPCGRRKIAAFDIEVGERHQRGRGDAAPQPFLVEVGGFLQASQAAPGARPHFQRGVGAILSQALLRLGVGFPAQQKIDDARAQVIGQGAHLRRGQRQLLEQRGHDCV
jgi:hypothetical protein